MTLGYFSMLLPIKLGFAGLFFAIFLKKIFGRNDWSIALFGSFYATCAWALGYQWNVMWLDTFAIVPLVMLGMVSLLEQRKFILYTLSLAMALLVNYYIGFFVCIFVLLSFICYQICRYQSFKKLIIDLALMAGYSLLALCMTMIVTMPAYMALQTTYSSVNNFPKELALNFTKENTLGGFFEAMGKVAGNMMGGITPNFKDDAALPNVYTGVGAVVMGFLFLTCKDLTRRERGCGIGMLLLIMASFVIKQLDYIWHGFHRTNMIPYRFSFLFSFVLLFMAYRTFLHWTSFKPWQVATATGLSLGMVLLSEKRAEPTFLVFNLVLIALYGAVYLYRVLPMKSWNKRKKKEQLALQEGRHRLCTRTLAGIMVVELILSLVNLGLHFPAANVSVYPRGKENSAAAIEYMKELEKDNLFYRAETTRTQTFNDGALNNYNGITAFTSSAFVNVTEFAQALGYPAKNNWNRYWFEESSPVANLFLNLKYMVERKGLVEENSYFDEVKRFENVVLLENNAYLPLGFLTNKELSTLKFPLTGNRFQFQNNLMKAASGVDYLWSSVPSDYMQVTGTTNITLTKTGADTYYYAASGAGSVTYSFFPQEKGFFCIDITQSYKRNTFDVRKNGKALYYGEDYTLPQMIAVSEVAPGDRIDIVVNCKSGDTDYLTITNGILNPERFRRAYDILNASTLQLTTFENTYMEGTINCNRDGLLYTSIPQNGNWIATVDGQEVETVQIGGAMLGIHLTAGEHQVTFTYRNDAYRAGVCITVISLLIFGALWLTKYKPYKKFLKEQ